MKDLATVRNLILARSAALAARWTTGTHTLAPDFSADYVVASQFEHINLLLKTGDHESTHELISLSSSLATMDLSDDFLAFTRMIWASSLFDRYRLSAHEEDFHQALDLIESARSLSCSNDTLYALERAGGRALYGRAFRSGDARAADESATYYKRAENVAPRFSPKRRGARILGRDARKLARRILNAEEYLVHEYDPRRANYIGILTARTRLAIAQRGDLGQRRQRLRMLTSSRTVRRTPTLPIAWSRLTTTLRNIYDETSELAALLEASLVGGWAYAAIPEDRLLVSELGVVYRMLGIHLGDATAVDRGVALSEEAIAGLQQNDSRWPNLAWNLAVALKRRQSHSDGDIADLDRAINLEKALIPLLEPSLRATALSNYATSLLTRGVSQQSSDDVNSAIGILELHMEEPIGRAERIRWSMTLGQAHFQRAKMREDEGNGEDDYLSAITVLSRVQSQLHTSHHLWPALAATIAECHLELGNESHTPEHHRLALAQIDLALRQVPAPDVELQLQRLKFQAISGPDSVLQGDAQFGRDMAPIVRRIQDLDQEFDSLVGSSARLVILLEDEAADALLDIDAIEASMVESGPTWQAVYELCQALQKVFETEEILTRRKAEARRLLDLSTTPVEIAFAYSEYLEVFVADDDHGEVAEVLPRIERHLEQVSSETVAGCELRVHVSIAARRFGLQLTISPLKELEMVWQHCEDNFTRVAAGIELGRVQTEQYRFAAVAHRFDSIIDLLLIADEVAGTVAAERNTVKAVMMKLHAADALFVAYLNRFHASMDRADLTCALALSNRTSSASQYDLAVALVISYEVTGQGPDLNLAIELFDDYLAETSNRNPYALAEYALACRLMAVKDQDSQMLGLAAESLMEANEQAAPREERKFVAYAETAVNLSLFTTAGDRSDLYAAAECARRMYGPPHVSLQLEIAEASTFSTVLLLLSQNAADSDEATRYLEEAAAVIDGIDLPSAGLDTRLRVEAQRIQIAILRHEDGMSLAESPIVGALKRLDRSEIGVGDPSAACLIWMSIARAHRQLGQLAEAAAAAYSFMDLMVTVAPIWMSRGDKEDKLSEFIEFFREAVALAIDCGDVERAVELFELARQVQAEDVLDAATMLRLQNQVPLLAEQLQAAVGEIGSSHAALLLEGHHDLRSRTVQVNRQAEIDSILDRIHALPGFSTAFVAPPKLNVAIGQTVIMLNPTRDRVDVLIIRNGGVGHFKIDVENSELDAAVQTLMQSLDEATGLQAPSSVRDPDEVVLAQFAWLWSHIAKRALDEAGVLGPCPTDSIAPRIHWMPAGVLSAVPWGCLTALPEDGNEPDGVIFRCASSVTPSLHRLRAASVAEARNYTFGTEMAVVMPQTPDSGPLGDLPNALNEVLVVQKRFPRARVYGTEGGLPAVHDFVLEGITEASWVHFACHAVSVPGATYRSAILLRDYKSRPLTAYTLSQVAKGERFLAFLSACSTSSPDATVSDAPLNIAAAMEATGFRHVVGTLWPVADEVGLSVASAFYDALPAGTVNDDDVAQSIRTATLTMQARFSRYPSIWAGYIHSGP